MFEIEAFWIIVESYVGPVPSSVKKLLEYLDLCNFGIVLPDRIDPNLLDWQRIAKQLPKSSEELLEPIQGPTLGDKPVCQAIYEALRRIEEKELVRLMHVCKAIAERKASVENAEDFTPPLNRSHFYEIESFWAIVESLVGPVPSRFKMFLQQHDLCNIGMLMIDCHLPSYIPGNPHSVSTESLLVKIHAALKQLGQTEFVRNMRICKDIIDRETEEDSEEEVIEDSSKK